MEIYSGFQYLIRKMDSALSLESPLNKNNSSTLLVFPLKKSLLFSSFVEIDTRFSRIQKSFLCGRKDKLLSTILYTNRTG